MRVVVAIVLAALAILLMAALIGAVFYMEVF
jgi:hypothetical protein